MMHKGQVLSKTIISETLNVRIYVLLFVSSAILHELDVSSTFTHLSLLRYILPFDYLHNISYLIYSKSLFTIASSLYTVYWYTQITQERTSNWVFLDFTIAKSSPK